MRTIFFRPFKQMLLIVLWVALTAYAGVFGIAAVPIIFDGVPNSEMYPRPQGVGSQAMLVPDSVVAAYKTGKMRSQDESQFEYDLRAGSITIPAATPLTIHLTYGKALRNMIGAVVVFLMPPVCLLLLLQYLVVGFANPVRLFASKVPDHVPLVPDRMSSNMSSAD